MYEWLRMGKRGLFRAVSLACLFLAIFLSSVLPAAADTTITTVAELVSRVSSVLNTIVPLIVGLSVLVIVWGIFRYISEAGDEEKRREARQFIVWGIIGVFFMLSIWGFVHILDNTFTLEKTIDQSKIPKVPQFRP